MLGLTHKDANADKLTVQVHTIAGSEVFGLAQKIWGENVRSLRVDPESGKEFLHFGYANPKCVVWLQHDKGRNDIYELIVNWQSTGTHEVYVIIAGDAQPVGDDTRAKAVLNSMLITPSVVLT
ncbi:MAG TPA: hypothetical protein VLE73_04400 [Candidatus Saccharimonadales bacterium]|nr:hypothetical protein [Candidatus Saccharimonadales bacterium]